MLVERYGLDPLRYYLMRSLPVGSDGTFTPEDYVGRINYELANDLGNLLNRTVSMINKYFDGQIPAYVEGVTEFDHSLAQVASESIADYHTHMEAVDYPRALEAVWTLISRTNKYIDETAPWVLAKDEEHRDQLASVMSHLAASLRVVAHMIEPFMMGTSRAVLAQLGLAEVSSLENLSLADFPADVTVVAKRNTNLPTSRHGRRDCLYQRTNGKQQTSRRKEWNPDEVELKLNKDEIKFEDFDKVEIRVAEVKEVSKVEGSDKLLQFRLDAGDGQDRQILSGIAKILPKRTRIGRQESPNRCQPQTTQDDEKYVSQGMILSAEHDGKLTLLTVDPAVPNGSVIG